MIEKISFVLGGSFMNTQAPEMKKANKLKIARFILEKGDTSKAEIAASLGLSMPTTLNGIKELKEQGVVIETGIYESTGGRKAKALSINPDGAYGVGIGITADHLQFVVTNLCCEILAKRRIRLRFADSLPYEENLVAQLNAFLEDSGIDTGKICGAGLSVPGLVDAGNLLVVNSHALGVVRKSFAPLAERLPWPLILEQEAYAAFASEYQCCEKNLVYLSLGSAVGGAVRINGQMHQGNQGRGARFGHTIIKRGGRSCYCGREGCAESYLSAKVLEKGADCPLEVFFARLAEKDTACTKLWNKYLDSLTVMVSNLHMLYDCDIILGGPVGGFLGQYRTELTKQLRRMSKEENTDYIRFGRFSYEASAYGLGCRIMEEELVKLCRGE